MNIRNICTFFAFALCSALLSTAFAATSAEAEAKLMQVVSVAPDGVSNIRLDSDQAIRSFVVRGSAPLPSGELTPKQKRDALKIAKNIARGKLSQFFQTQINAIETTTVEHYLFYHRPDSTAYSSSSRLKIHASSSVFLSGLVPLFRGFTEDSAVVVLGWKRPSLRSSSHTNTPHTDFPQQPASPKDNLYPKP